MKLIYYYMEWWWCTIIVSAHFWNAGKQPFFLPLSCPHQLWSAIFLTLWILTFARACDLGGARANAREIGWQRHRGFWVDLCFGASPKWSVRGTRGSRYRVRRCSSNMALSTTSLANHWQRLGYNPTLTCHIKHSRWFIGICFIKTTEVGWLIEAAPLVRSQCVHVGRVQWRIERTIILRQANHVLKAIIQLMTGPKLINIFALTKTIQHTVRDWLKLSKITQ